MCCRIMMAGVLISFVICSVVKSEDVMPKREHFAFCHVEGYLDGPKGEAWSSVGKIPDIDEDGNAWFVSAEGDGAVRVILTNGLVRTVAGDNRWQGSLDIDEGPAAFIPHLQRVAGIGNPVTSIAVLGRPLKDGPDGKPMGYILSRGGHGTGKDKCVYKIFRNKEKGGRWWFKVIAGTGKTPPPNEVGKTVNAIEVGFRRLPFFNKFMVNGRYDMYFQSDGMMWLYDDEKGTLTCVLSTSDYAGKPEIGNDKLGKPLGPAEGIVITPDGSFYLNWYTATYPKGVLAKISPDRKTVRRVAQDIGDVNKRWDGDAMKDIAFFGGPLLGSAWPPDVVVVGAVDDCQLRRFKDGRVSTLCKDGNWREFPTKQASTGPQYGAYAVCPPDKAPLWGRSIKPYPLKSADDREHYFLQIYQGAVDDHNRWWRIGPVDFSKPTVGPLVGGGK